MVMLVFPPKKTVTEFSNRKKGAGDTEEKEKGKATIAASPGQIQSIIRLFAENYGGRSAVRFDRRFWLEQRGEGVIRPFQDEPRVEAYECIARAGGRT
ncbi:hypothetical protein EVAR_98124_1 [Eumeta japonica]|uniref:Uncharacterized protein n=1 Tax=Eumeta variegata TaxID=151549 RepID=A0A4C2A7X3_EUMVA|nr:hypothetical protein EVAR_98124_1 [Eumeta japonica]